MKYIYVFNDPDRMIAQTTLENMAKEIIAMCKAYDHYVLFTPKELLADMKDREANGYYELFDDEKFGVPVEWEWAVHKVPLFTKFIPID